MLDGRGVIAEVHSEMQNRAATRDGEIIVIAVYVRGVGSFASALPPRIPKPLITNSGPVEFGERALVLGPLGQKLIDRIRANNGREIPPNPVTVTPEGGAVIDRRVLRVDPLMSISLAFTRLKLNCRLRVFAG